MKIWSDYRNPVAFSREERDKKTKRSSVSYISFFFLSFERTIGLFQDGGTIERRGDETYRRHIDVAIEGGKKRVAHTRKRYFSIVDEIWRNSVTTLVITFFLASKNDRRSPIHLDVHRCWPTIEGNNFLRHFSNPILPNEVKSSLEKREILSERISEKFRRREGKGKVGAN